MNHEHPEPVAPSTPHGRYRVGTTVWRGPTDVHRSGTLVVQCPCPGAHETTGQVEAKRTDKDGISAWVVTASGPDPQTAADQAAATADTLGAFLPGGA